jgi:hypothetical protein
MSRHNRFIIEYQHQTGDTNMTTYRRTAIIVGVLFIIGTLAGVLSVVFAGDNFEEPINLANIAANKTSIQIAGLFVLLMGFALALVPMVIYPIIRKESEALALGYVIFRGALETVIYILMVTCWMFLVFLCQEAAKTGTLETTSFQALSTILLKGHHSITAISEIVFPLGALMFYSLLYRTRLIPRWLSGWGFLGAILFLGAGIYYYLTGTELEPILMVLGVQEMVMAVWLIAKGFNAPAVGHA